MKLLGKYGYILLCGLAGIFTSGYLYVRVQENSYRDHVISNLEHTVNVALATMDPTAFTRLQAQPADKTTEDYIRTREQMVNLQGIFALEGIRGIYAMNVNSQQIRFFVDSASESDPWHSEPGVVYEEPPAEIRTVARDGHLRFVGPYSDEYGKYYSIFASERTPTGLITAVIGADIESSWVDAALWDQREFPILLTIFSAGLFTIGFFIVARRKELEDLMQKHERELQKKNEDLLEEEERSEDHRRRLELLIEQLPVGVFIAEPKHGKPVMANKKTVELIGRNVDKNAKMGMYAKTYDLLNEDGSIYPEEDLPLVETLRTGKTATKSHIFVKHPDGKQIALRVISVPIKNAKGHLTSAVVVLEDMTAEYDIDRQKSEFIYVASHELRTPLAVIKWYIDLLTDKSAGNLNIKQKQLADQIHLSNEQMISLVNELLNVSRLESGMVGVVPQNTDLNTLIREGVTELKPLFEAKHLKLSVKTAKLPLVSIDPKLIQKVILNLLSNAIKYTKAKGRIVMTTELRKKDVLISVTDNGMGIPKDQQKNIFKKLFRADNAIESKIDGTGLGLYVSQQAVQISGGEIGFESTENVGTTFWFTIPLAGSKGIKGGKGLM